MLGRVLQVAEDQHPGCCWLGVMIRLLCFDGCEGKEQLDAIQRQIKGSRRELDLLSEEGIVALLTAELLLSLDFMHAFPLLFRWK